MPKQKTHKGTKKRFPPAKDGNGNGGAVDIPLSARQAITSIAHRLVPLGSTSAPRHQDMAGGPFVEWQ